MTEGQLAGWLEHPQTIEFMKYLKTRADELGEGLLQRNVIPEDISAYNFQLGIRFSLLGLRDKADLKIALCPPTEEDE